MLVAGNFWENSTATRKMRSDLSSVLFGTATFISLLIVACESLSTFLLFFCLSFFSVYITLDPKINSILILFFFIPAFDSDRTATCQKKKKNFFPRRRFAACVLFFLFVVVSWKKKSIFFSFLILSLTLDSCGFILFIYFFFPENLFG